MPRTTEKKTGAENDNTHYNDDMLKLFLQVKIGDAVAIVC